MMILCHVFPVFNGLHILKTFFIFPALFPLKDASAGQLQAFFTLRVCDDSCIVFNKNIFRAVHSDFATENMLPIKFHKFPIRTASWCKENCKMSHVHGCWKCFTTMILPCPVPQAPPNCPELRNFLLYMACLEWLELEHCVSCHVRRQITVSAHFVHWNWAFLIRYLSFDKTVHLDIHVYRKYLSIQLYKFQYPCQL